MEITRKNPATVAPPVGPYSHLVRVAKDVEWIFISGQVGLDESGEMPSDVYSQTVNTFRNIEQLLASEGLGPDSVVRLLTFLVGEENWAEFRRARSDIFEEWFPDGVYPGQSFTYSPALARADVLIEVEGWAVAPAAGSDA